MSEQYSRFMFLTLSPSRFLWFPLFFSLSISLFPPLSLSLHVCIYTHTYFN